MVDINLLDKTLNYIHKKGGLPLSEDDNPHFTKEENEYLQQAAQRLQKDGFAKSNDRGNQFFITFDGLLALDETFLLRNRNRPYKRMRAMSGWKNAWLFVKVVALTLNGLALLILAILTFFFKS